MLHKKMRESVALSANDIGQLDSHVQNINLDYSHISYTKKALKMNHRTEWELKLGNFEKKTQQ